ncbi:MaoC/PaaZ C-terminal domain-containing protein [Tropicimonas sp. IMCC6043]|uniref:MaoC family dehydratase n=1 Tax=Tropicimonas sp. IMCC6043 TaxID=2510645 RepID=UPI00101E04C9|nr:MaoC/PaaZ C-terminal domain-containing protein [Tropicimonas sp. IMCC6043]RYH06667.1 dehydratase [Tropicimonas sp. IMCC6043]
MASSAPFLPGETHRFRKTVGESDVYLFAGITGDLSPNHVDEAAMARTPFGGRIAHGALIVGYMSACSTMACEGRRSGPFGTPVSIGYDRIRFIAPVRIGDTIEVTYVLDGFDSDRRRSTASVTVTNQSGDTVAVATHLMAWVED